MIAPMYTMQVTNGQRLFRIILNIIPSLAPDIHSNNHTKHTFQTLSRYLTDGAHGCYEMLRGPNRVPQLGDLDYDLIVHCLIYFTVLKLNSLLPYKRRSHGP